LAQRARKNCDGQSIDDYRFGATQEMHSQVRLIALPGIAVPDAARRQGIMVSGNDEYRTGIRRTFQHSKGPRGVDTGNGVIVEEIARDENELDLQLPRLLA
jgi:hypothetical protein